MWPTSYNGRTMVTRRKHNRKATKAAMMAEYVSKHGHTEPKILAAEIGVSEDYAARWVRKWGREIEDFKSEPKTKTVFRAKNYVPNNPKHSIQDISTEPSVSDGSTASYYELPEGAEELQDLISYKNMNAQIGEIFRAAYRYGESSHSDQLRDAKKIRFYIDAEIKRLEG